MLEEVVFVRATKMKNYSKACFFKDAEGSEDPEVFLMEVVHDEEKETMTLKPTGGVQILIQNVIEIYVFEPGQQEDRCQGDVPEESRNGN